MFVWPALGRAPARFLLLLVIFVFLPSPCRRLRCCSSFAPAGDDDENIQNPIDTNTQPRKSSLPNKRRASSLDGIEPGNPLVAWPYWHTCFSEKRFHEAASTRRRDTIMIRLGPNSSIAPWLAFLVLLALYPADATAHGESPQAKAATPTVTAAPIYLPYYDERSWSLVRGASFQQYAWPLLYAFGFNLCTCSLPCAEQLSYPKQY